MNAFALLLLLSVGDPPATESCDAICERRRAEERLAAGELRPAIERLADAIDRFPDDPALPLVLARAYLLDGNLFWAEKALRGALVLRPGDVETSAWLALVHLREGDPELAGEALAANPEPEAGPDRTRRALLAAYRATLVGDDAGGRSLLGGIGRAALAFPEDRRAWGLLKRRLDPWWTDPLTIDGELAGGTTSNALAGAPTDPGAAGTSSGMMEGTLRMRVAPALSPVVRPVLDLEAEAHPLFDGAYRELSTFEGSGRIGVLMSVGGYRTLAGYRAEVLELDQTPSRFSEAHRGEVEIESTRGWIVFGGAGRRTYRDARRTRDEWDLGGGGPFRPSPRTSIALGATLRGASAESPAFDLRGASVTAAVRVGLRRNLAARITGTASWDDYLHSGGADGLLAFGTTARRRDLTGKATVGVWLPPVRGMRVGFEGQLARRDSTADDRPGFDFDYTESRVLLLVRFGLGADRSAPRRVEVPGHVPLEWGLGAGESGENERIIDLLRQDEELRRGSSCGT